MIARLLLRLLAAALVIGACGSDDGDVGESDVAALTDGTSTTQRPPTEATAATEETEPVDVVDAGDRGAIPAFLDFTLEGVGAEQVEGAAYAGRDLVVWFWSPWCTKCNATAPAMAETVAGRDDVAFLGIAGLDEKDAASAFVQRHGLEGFPHAHDENGDIWQEFGITTQSSFAFVDEDGTFDTVSYVAFDADELDALVDELVAR